MNYDFHVIDAHNHFRGRDLVGDKVSCDPDSLDRDFDQDLRERLSILDERGVNEAIIIGNHHYLRSRGLKDTQILNDDLARYRNRARGRLVAAVGIVEPTYGHYGLTEIDRCRDELGFLGISFHARFQGVAMNDSWVKQCLVRMQDSGMIPFVHAVGETPDEALWKVDVLASEFPEMTFVILDAFSTFDQSEHVLHIAERHTNLIFETGTAHALEPILQVIANLGAHRVMYGSDLYDGKQTRYLYQILRELMVSELSEEEKRMVVSGNAQQLLMNSSR